MRLYWEKAEALDFGSLLRLVPLDVFASPRRSVLPLLDLFRTPAAALESLTRATGLDLRDATDLVFEYAVPVQRGSGKASYSDLAIFAANASLIVEAKYTEPEYQTVSKWLGSPASSNRIDVLEGWLHLLRRVSLRPMSPSDVSELPYQLVHRAASACFPEVERRGLAYLVFGDHVPAHYLQHVAALKTLLDPNQISLSVLDCAVQRSSVCLELEARWDAGARDLASEVKSSMLMAPLHSFGVDPLSGGGRQALSV